MQKSSADYGYAPCQNGLHVCGHDGAEEYPVTVANIEGISASQFDILAAHFAVEENGDFDMVVDFQSDGDTIMDFGIRRQSLEALLKSARDLIK